MRLTYNMKKQWTLLVLVLIGPFIWGGNNEKQDHVGVYILTHDEIVHPGARTLADVLARVPGVRIAANSSQNQPSSGPLASADSPTQLSANQFSRVLIMFNGHSLNKNWYGGADQDWGTGFLEGLKEIRVYTGPAAMAKNGGAGAMDMIIDLIPFDGKDQDGAVDFRISQSFNEDRADKSLLHLRTGNRWGENGNYTVFADVTRWAGADVREGWGVVEPGHRMDRKNPTFQVGALVQKGAYDFIARHLEHYLFDPNDCGRKWSYTFIEGSRRFQFPGRWDMKITGSADYINSRWGAGSSITGKAVGDRDKVNEFRLALRAEFSRRFKTTAVYIGADFQNVRIDGGPERSDDYYSIMTFSTQRGIGGASLRLVQNLSDSWRLQGAVRIEKAKGYAGVGFLPGISLFYLGGKTNFGLDFAVGHRYMDSWYRVGSSNYNPGGAVAMTPYVIPVELEPERNLQLKAWVEKQFPGSWTVYAGAFIGKYSHLMGYDWGFALDSLFNQVRAVEVGNYSYWGGTGSLTYKGTKISFGANASFQGVSDSDLGLRQLYVSQDGKDPLYLPAFTANVFLDWSLLRRLALSVTFNTSAGARNAGVDYMSADYGILFNKTPYENTPSLSNLDISLRLFDFWKGFECQLTGHNVFNHHGRMVIVEGGSFLSRGREITLTLRGQF